jgi:hypothetical protein
MSQLIAVAYPGLIPLSSLDDEPEAHLDAALAGRGAAV